MDRNSRPPLLQPSFSLPHHKFRQTVESGIFLTNARTRKVVQYCHPILIAASNGALLQVPPEVRNEPKL
jgi:hypothetical protein